MYLKFNQLIITLLLLVFTGCYGNSASRTQIKANQITQPAAHLQFLQTERALFGSDLPGENIDLDSVYRSLDELAELERAGVWFQGLALTESGLREYAGDYAGAVIAAYKELAWAYGLGLIEKKELEQGLLNILAVNKTETVIASANAILAFMKNQWNNAASGLSQFINEFDEPDGFGRWMFLVCILEENNALLMPETPVNEQQSHNNRQAGAAYRSMRARYAQFPEYWYRGARVFSGIIAADFAENCINLSVQGPFADECRMILASHTGLKTEEGLFLKTKKEIESVISISVNSGNPQILDSLFPLISLPDNPYTVYAVSALRSLSVIPVFRDYFYLQASAAGGRLAERLSYIYRG